ncbi:HD-GYP domain-containing protein [Sedimenticola selenatireducens]|uniref:HD-GYP domain-containing protein n=1 Tax=Sedimenticola selenatireducens TaxID=191960 RepID=A0A558DSX2_9GAMM|nr:HD-GYP domain-containing protein [Sedimenticola selenatireducens]TVO76702.1 HD-GYP domain-containing protein [Sedimenticola selenatireducens]TVT64145.1 MAG: HD-GYP domain-containing protein [Sedimenticola selenatireducens]
MGITTLTVHVKDLQPGMYVSSLDRPWLETPYPIQGFMIRSGKDRERLQQFCEFVYVDVVKSRANSIPKRIIVDNEKATLPSDAAQIYQLTQRDRIPYEKTTSRESELADASTYYDQVGSTYKTLLQDAENDKQLNIPVLKKSIAPMVKSIIQNPDAFIWLTHLKSLDNYSYHHAVSCAVWAVAFGRHLGLPEAQLNSLATGCFLFDIGKTKLPKSLLRSTKRLTVEQFETVKQHVLFGIELVKQTRGIRQEVFDMIRTHHERHNGSGYPLGLSRDQIPLFGRIAGIVDAYDAITSHRPYCPPLPAYEAIEALYQWRGVDFQTELVEQFIQVVGIYPVGSLVELSNASVAVVIGQNEHYRLRPKVMVLLGNDKKLLEEFYEVDLREGLDNDDAPSLTISKGLPPGAYNLDSSHYYF